MTAMATSTPPPADDAARRAVASRRGLGGEEIPEGEDRILTVPNVITLVRLLCIPVFLWLLFGAEPPDRIAAAVLLAVLGGTDWVDGYVARHFHQVSNLGKMFDPIVDRALLVFGVGGIIVDGSVPLWLGLFVVIREVVLSTWVISITALGATRMDVTWFGKAQTFAMMIAFPLFLASADTSLSEGTADLLRTVAWCFAVPGLVLSVIAFVGYFPAGVRALREGRAQRAAAAAGAPGRD
jgi:cardiolipin synthase